MQSRNEFEDALNEWSPEVRRKLNQLGYLDGYLKSREIDRRDLVQLGSRDGVDLAARLWADHLDGIVELNSSQLILVLEHLRRHPAAALQALRKTKSRQFAPTLANVSFRVADSVYEDAKALMYRGDIDRAMSRFAMALDEFRFAIESERLTDATLRQAFGKFATAVAFSGRWRKLSAATLIRALDYSERSLDLGNVDVTTIVYRIEILLQAFDLLGDPNFLHRAQGLSRSYPDLVSGTEMAQAEVRLRLALTDVKQVDQATYLRHAEFFLRRSAPGNQFDRMKKVVLEHLVSEVSSGFRPSPREVGIPNGLIAALRGPERERVANVLRDIVGALDPLWRDSGSNSAGVTSAQLLRGLCRSLTLTQNPQDGVRYVEVTAWIARNPEMDRHLHWEAASAALDRGIARADSTLAWEAHDRFVELIDRYPHWPLPRIGLARAVESLRAMPDRRGGWLPQAEDAWREAAQLAIDAPDYREESLGGRNSVFAVEDARGFMSEAFVFKPMAREGATFEAETLEKMARAIGELDREDSFAVPASLAVIPWDGGRPGGVVHVVQRAQGVEIGSLGISGRANALPRTLELLSVFHKATGQPQPGRSPWRTLKANLKLCLRSLISVSDSDSIVSALKKTLPSDLPLVMKRDAHGGNWLQDDAGRIVAIDMESRDYLPIGHDVAQLIEDSVMLPVDRDSWSIRLHEWHRYLMRLGMVPTSRHKLATVYEWFALYRAIWLGTAPEATKAQRRHARELSTWLAAMGDSQIQSVAIQISDLLLRAESREAAVRTQSANHKRTSKGLAYLLRHRGPEVGIPVDNEGFASSELVANYLGVSIEELSGVVEHPAELRFQQVDGQVRALYGHSLPVRIDALIAAERPDRLYHGSSWDRLEGILDKGISPMSRQRVHLSNSTEEALEVGRRHGAGVVFEVEVVTDLDPVPVADGLWVTGPVPASALSLANPFSGFVGRST